MLISILLIQIILIALKMAAACESCRSLAGYDSYLSVIGLAFYALVAVLHILKKDVSKLILIALACHIALLIVSLRLGYWCAYCLGCALCAMTAAFFARSFRHMRIANTFSCAALFVPLLVIPITSEAADGDGRVQLTAYVRDGCRYCEMLRMDILPALDEAHVNVRVVDASDSPIISRFPTVIVSKGSYIKIIEGLPETAELIRVIEEARRSQ